MEAIQIRNPPADLHPPSSAFSYSNSNRRRRHLPSRRCTFARSAAVVQLLPRHPVALAPDLVQKPRIKAIANEANYEVAAAGIARNIVLVKQNHVQCPWRSIVGKAGLRCGPHRNLCLSPDPSPDPDPSPPSR